MRAERGGASAVPAHAPAPGGGSEPDAGGSGPGSRSVLPGQRRAGSGSGRAAARDPEAAELHPHGLQQGGGPELHEEHQACENPHRQVTAGAEGRVAVGLAEADVNLCVSGRLLQVSGVCGQRSSSLQSWESEFETVPLRDLQTREELEENAGR